MVIAKTAGVVEGYMDVCGEYGDYYSRTKPNLMDSLVPKQGTQLTDRQTNRHTEWWCVCVCVPCAKGAPFPFILLFLFCSQTEFLLKGSSGVTNYSDTQSVRRPTMVRPRGERSVVIFGRRFFIWHQDSQQKSLMLTICHRKRWLSEA